MEIKYFKTLYNIYLHEFELHMSQDCFALGEAIGDVQYLWRVILTSGLPYKWGSLFVTAVSLLRQYNLWNVEGESNISNFTMSFNNILSV